MFVHPSRGRGRQQLLQLVAQLSYPLEAPTVVYPAVSLLSAISCPLRSACGRGHAAAAAEQRFSCRGVSSKASREAALDSETVAASERPPEIISKALLQGPFELTFAAKAYYIGSKIDIGGLQKRAEKDRFPTQFSAKNDSTLICVKRGPMPSYTQHMTGLPLETYMMAFSYGSVVIFNAQSELLTKALLNMCRDHTKQQHKEQYAEEMMIRICPHMDVWSMHSPEAIKLQQLDWSNMRVISAVLGQSVALDFYARSVERMLDRFVDMNLEMQKTGNLSASISKDELLKLVAQNNLILTDIITKLNILDYSPEAWKVSQYGRIWEYLRREFDVEARFETIENKLELVQENLKYYLDLRQHAKSDTLEWTIIILIGAEIVISLSEMYLRLMGDS